jgi:hypothetical protein
MVGLGACGGGGGGGETQPAPTAIDITATNRDSVAHASAATVLSSSPTAAIPLSSASATPNSALGGRLTTLLLQPLRNRGSVDSGREQPLAIVGPVVEPCAFGGSLSLTVDDRDNNGALSVGDVLTFVFSQCHDTASDFVNGTTTGTYTQIGTGPAPTIGARLTMTEFTAVTANHTLTLNRAMLLSYSKPSTSVEITRLTADGPVTVAFSTHLPYADTVTLQGGYMQEDTYDASVAAPPGGTVAGRTTTTLQGRLHSIQAGGVVDVATPPAAPLVMYSADAYPSSGAVQVTGPGSKLLMTAVSATSVRLDLDADNNGSFESTSTVSWDWLL